jgi:hypothetical protein
MSDIKWVLPGPADYNTDLGKIKRATSFVQEQPKCAIPRAYRKFDIIKYGCISNEIIKKGIY